MKHGPSPLPPYALKSVGAMILGSMLAHDTNISEEEAVKFLFFPLVVHAMNIVVSSAGVAMVGVGGRNVSLMVQLQKGYRCAMVLSIVGFYFITRWLLEDPGNPGGGAGFRFFFVWDCGYGVCVHHCVEHTVLY